jgi:hypothetical protein
LNRVSSKLRTVSTHISGLPFVISPDGRASAQRGLADGVAGRPATGKTNAGERIEFELRKIGRSAPWGVPRRRPWVAVSFQECNLPVFFPSRWRLSPLFDEGGQILFFPAPISYLGERYFAGCWFPYEAIPARTRWDIPRLIR